MNSRNYKTRLQVCNLSDALVRNITDDISSVSFEINSESNIQVKVIVKDNFEEFDEILEDISVEFSAVQNTDCVEPFMLVKLGDDNLPLNNIVYRQKTD